MPSPFPGMDPYFEERSRWPNLHQRLINNIAEAIQPEILPKYVAIIGERIEVTSLNSPFVPDDTLVRSPLEPAAAAHQTGVLIADEPFVFTVVDEKRRVPYLEIIYRETGDVVTSIEALSPSNKYSYGHEEYLHKQNQLLLSHVNLVEIDLLGYGRPTTLARTVEIEKANWRYNICVSRGYEPGRLEIYAFSLWERLPCCRIPLREEDDDVVLDLPAVFNRCYDVGAYAALIDYAQTPPVNLSEREAEWLTAHLQNQHQNGSTA